MSLAKSAIACVNASSMRDDDKDALIKEIEDADYDSSTGKLIFSDATVAEKLMEKVDLEIKAKQQAAYAKAVQLDRALQNLELINRVFESKGAEGLKKWFDDLLTQDNLGDVARSGAMSIETSGKVIYNELTMDLNEVAAKFGEKIMGGVQDPELQKEFVLAVLRNDFTHPEWGELAKTTVDVLEKARLMYNDAGGSLAKRASYIFPTRHDPDALVNEFGGFDGWRDHIKKNFDVYNPETGQPFSGEHLDQALAVIYENVTTGRPDAPLVKYQVLTADGKKRQVSAAVREERIAYIESASQKPVNDSLADDLDMQIAKKKTEIQSKKEVGGETAGLKSQLDELQEQRSAILTVKEVEKLAKEKAELEVAVPFNIAGEQIGDMPLHKLRAQERAIVPKNAEAWLEYQRRNGVEDFFGAMVGNLQQMSQEIALMKQFGPDAQQGFNFMADTVLNKAPDGKIKSWISKGTKKSKVVNTWFNTKGRWESYMRILTGEVNRGGQHQMAKWTGVLRNYSTGTKLAGSTFTTAFGDLHTGWVTAGYAGTGRMKTLMAQMRNAMSRRNAHTANMGLGISHMVNDMSAMNRYTEIADTATMSAKYADVMMRLNGMAHLTRMADQTLPMRINQLIAENISRDWDDLPKAFRKGTMERFGITPEDWADIQKARDGIAYLSPEGFTDVKQGSGIYMDMSALEKFLEPERAAQIRQKIMYATETMRSMAVMRSTVQARAITTMGGMSQDSLAGSLGRLFTQFMSFPLSYVHQHIMTGYRLAKAGQGPDYLLQMFLASSLSGALIIQADELRKGRNPRDMASVKFWGESTVRGGGGGFYVDMILAMAAGEKEAGRKMLGPGVGTVAQVLGDATSAGGKAVEGDFGRAMAEFVYGATDLSFTKSHVLTAMLHQEIVDGAAKFFDAPYVRDKQLRSRRYWEREYGSSQWYDRVTGEPEVPNLGTAFGGEE